VLEGRLEEALEFFERELRIIRGLGEGNPQTEALYAARVAEVLARTGRSRAAEERAREAVKISREIGSRMVEAFALEALGLAREQCGRTAEAAEALEEAVEIRREGGDRRDLGGALLRLGSLRLRTGDAIAAAACFREARAVGTESGDPAVTVRSGAHLARLGEIPAEEARRAFAEHRDRLGLLDRMETAFVLHGLDGEREFLGEARRMLDVLRSRAPVSDRRAIVTEVPLHREILAAAGDEDRDTGAAGAESCERRT